jgi:hypothetical protein
MKSRRKRWLAHVARMGKKIIAFRILVAAVIGTATVYGLDDREVEI